MPTSLLRQVLSLSLFYLLAQACSPAQVLPFKQDLGWLNLNDRGTRYEGLADYPNAKRDYEIRGLFALRPAAQTSTQNKETLHLTYFVPAGGHVASVLVQELHPETLYLMELKPKAIPSLPGRWNTYSDWPAATVITPHSVAPSNLGVLIREDDGSLLPALLYSTPAPAACAVPTAALKKEYALEFISHKELREVDCNVLDASGGRHSCRLVASRKKDLRESEPAEFLIPNENLPPGLNTIRIQGRYANTLDARLDAEVRFLHTPISDPCR